MAGLSFFGYLLYSEAPPVVEAIRLPPLCSLPAVLPKFELLIDPPHYIRDLDSCETGTVQAR